MSALAPIAAMSEPLTLRIRDCLTYEDWAACGRDLRRFSTKLQFAIGDWLRFGEHRYGEVYSNASEITGYSEGYLRNLAWVAGAIPPIMRRDSLAFSYHQSVADSRLTDEQRVFLLEKAPDFTRDAFRLIVKDFIRNLALPEPPTVKVSFATGDAVEREIAAADVHGAVTQDDENARFGGKPPILEAPAPAGVSEEGTPVFVSGKANMRRCPHCGGEL